MHFGHLRQENEDEQIDKSLTDTWKLFQKSLSDAADFVAQQTLIIKERLRDTFEVKSLIENIGFQSTFCFSF